MEPKPFREKIKWISVATYVDVDTGEMIDRYTFRHHYTIINHYKKTTINAKKNQGLIKWHYEGKKKAEQLRIF